jgi:hypothetical protein
MGEFGIGNRTFVKEFLFDEFAPSHAICQIKKFGTPSI